MDVDYSYSCSRKILVVSSLPKHDLMGRFVKRDHVIASCPVAQASSNLGRVAQ